MNKRDLFFRLSIMLNIVLIISLLFIGYKFRAKIINRIAPSRSYTIVMLGNSLTASGSWNKDLNRSDIKNCGYKGFTTSHFVWLLNRAVIRYNPKICFIEGGVNDIEVGISLKRTFKNYQSIVDTLLKHQIEPILQSTLYVNYSNDSLTNYINSKVDSLNIFLVNLATKKGFIYLDLNQYLSANGRLRRELNTDGTHLNKIGYQIWVREVDKILKSKEL